MKSLKISLLVSTVVMFEAAGFALQAAPESKKEEPAPPQSNQKQFNTPKEAADSLIEAAATFDIAVLTEILGPDSKDILSSEDTVSDKNKALAFAAKAKEKTEVGADSKNPEVRACVEARQ